MAIDPALAEDPELTRLKTIAAFSARRVERIEEKLRAIEEERIRAAVQLAEDQVAIKRWIENNPPAQGDLLGAL